MYSPKHCLKLKVFCRPRYNFGLKMVCRINILVAFLLAGIKVTITCADDNGQVTMSREETTNMFGNYVRRFDGTPDLNNCHAQVSGSEQGSNDCVATAGPAQKLRLMFRMFDMEIYSVDSLLSEPAQPMSFCPRSANPVPVPVVTPTRPSGPTAPKGSPPFRLPPLPRFPPLPPLPPMPPLPFSEASACSHQYVHFWDFKILGVMPHFGTMVSKVKVPQPT